MAPPFVKVALLLYGICIVHRNLKKGGGKTGVVPKHTFCRSGRFLYRNPVGPGHDLNRNRSSDTHRFDGN